MPWVYLHRNMSGKYTVIDLEADASQLDEIEPFLNQADDNYSDGVYIWTDKLRLIDLIYTTLDCDDFYFPNGDFRQSIFELHSLISDGRLHGDSSPYLASPTSRPVSETEGYGQLGIVGQTFSNIPKIASTTYIHRPQLEDNVYSALMNDRHAIITLKGRGGIGKTSAALAVIRKVSETNRFNIILWFSARDIDLLTTGAKTVQPRVMSEKDIADLYCTL